MSDFRHGLVIGKFYPPHAGHHFLIRSAADACDRVTVVVMAADVESIPLAARVGWIREAWAGDPHVRVVGTADNLEVDYDSEEVWAGHVALMRAAVGDLAPAVDAVFSSEPYGVELARRFAAAPVVLDRARDTFPVSGTKVRADPVAHWADLEPPVRAGLARRVVVLGAESTGTTTLSRDLAEALRARGGVHALTGWVPEYGRELTVAKLAVARARTADGPEPTVFDLEWTDRDFEVVCRRQTEAEERAARAGGPVLVCDTDALATTVWQERYVGAVTPEVAALAGALPPRALYLLTSEVGVDFEDDGLRDGEHLRAWMNGRFREVLAGRGVPWLELAGSRAERLERALAAVDRLLTDGPGLADPLG
ncbi:nicotinamide-nucleotide adenylyltransferase [Kitasatospora paracochleata]|uniref:NadR type nicotinamide-nucleotide adenylyltransferase n=1 Tax=Kitasatospora paracochleata TaxID=58354 RepID=A0ABT1IRM6_9ACTN|nr:AAA family ATPase [Kitasatospora paracochleata]MCP2307649.1 NadR type nicotinamide-nucleotide adenylyltransferase [Kitasatospora paracochleata]